MGWSMDRVHGLVHGPGPSGGPWSPVHILYTSVQRPLKNTGSIIAAQRNIQRSHYRTIQRRQILEDILARTKLLKRLLRLDRSSPGLSPHFHPRNSRGQGSGLQKCTGKPSTQGYFTAPLSTFSKKTSTHNLKNSPHPLICCECRIIYKAQKQIINQDFTEKKQYLFEKNIRAEGFT